MYKFDFLKKYLIHIVFVSVFQIFIFFIFIIFPRFTYHTFDITVYLKHFYNTYLMNNKKLFFEIIGWEILVNVVILYLISMPLTWIFNFSKINIRKVLLYFILLFLFYVIWIWIGILRYPTLISHILTSDESGFCWKIYQFCCSYYGFVFLSLILFLSFFLLASYRNIIVSIKTFSWVFIVFIYCCFRFVLPFL